jgi:caffeoyl-CoA O-methyltransferase
VPIDFILPAANAYALEHSSRQDPLLVEIEQWTKENHPEAHMLSGPVQGMLLTMISTMVRPRRILEIGSFVGYSALCLAKGLTGEGVLHTIEKREEDGERALSFIRKSENADKIQLHLGEGAAWIEKLEEDWDLVFVDADKTGYLGYYQTLIEKVKPGTWLLFDNVLFHGEVLNEKPSGKNAKAIAAFNSYIKNDERVEKLMLTVRDGITVVQKK